MKPTNRVPQAPASLTAWRDRPDHERYLIADYTAKVVYFRDRSDTFASARARSRLLNGSAVPTDILNEADINEAPVAIRRLLKRRPKSKGTRS